MTSIKRSADLCLSGALPCRSIFFSGIRFTKLPKRLLPRLRVLIDGVHKGSVHVENHEFKYTCSLPLISTRSVDEPGPLADRVPLAECACAVVSLERTATLSRCVAS